MNFLIKKGRWILVLCILSSLVFLSFFIWSPSEIEETVEVLTLDYRFQARNYISKPGLSGDVVIVAIDEKSLREFGRWPWSRILIAKVVSEIINSNPDTLAVDIFFSEPENEKADNALGEVFREYKDKLVLASVFDVWVKKKNKGIKDVPEQIIDSAILRIINAGRVSPIEADNLFLTVPQISHNNIIGHVYSHPDRDGKLRWEVLYIKYGDELFPSFALQAARLSFGISLNDVIIDGDTGVKVADRISIPTDRNGRMLVNYYGKEGTFKYFSAADILNGRINIREFENRIVMLGTTAISTYDLKNTPFSANMPGVEKNATVVENILTGNFIHKSKGYIEVFVIVLTGIVMGFSLMRLSALKGAIFSFVMFSGFIVSVILVFSFTGLWVNFIYPAANIMIISVVVTVAKYFLEEKKAKQIRAMFSSYVSPKIVEALISNPEKMKLGGERKIVTVLFTDIIGFTSFSEKSPPEDVVDMLNEYFKEMAEIVFRWDGTLDKFVGDEIMAFWGAPVDQANHAELAVKCAMNMTDSLSKMQAKWMKQGRDILDCGIGINSGEVVIGNIGAADKKMDYTIIGDHVNLAARVEKLTRHYGAKIILTEFTVDHLKPAIEKNYIGHYQLKKLEAVRVKGKEKEVDIFELKSLQHNGN